MSQAVAEINRIRDEFLAINLLMSPEFFGRKAALAAAAIEAQWGHADDALSDKEAMQIDDAYENAVRAIHGRSFTFLVHLAGKENV